MEILIFAILMIIDYASGVLNAVHEKKLKSAIMRDGIYHKIADCILIGTVYCVGLYVQKEGLFEMQYLTVPTITFMILKESLSIIENVKKLGGNVPKNLDKKLGKILESEDIGND